MSAVETTYLIGPSPALLVPSEGLHELYDVYSASFSQEQKETWSQKGFKEILALDGVGICLARAGKDLVGLAITRQVLDEAELLAVCVAPAWRARGIARATMDAVMSALSKSGIRRLYLEVRESNQAAIELYKSCGFVQCGGRKGYYGDQQGRREDALLFERALVAQDNQ